MPMFSFSVTCQYKRSEQIFILNSARIIVFIISRAGPTACIIQKVLPIYFDFRLSVAQTKPVDKDDKQSVQDSKNDFTLKLFSDQAEANVHTDDLETLQGLLKELRRSHLIAQDDNFYAGGSSHRWVQYYKIDDTPNEKELLKEGVPTMEEFISSTSNPLSKYFLQPEEGSLPYFGTRLDLGSVKESWIEKEMRAREIEFTEYSFMNAFVGTWNVNGKNAPDNLDLWLKVKGEIQPDIYVLCFQELDLRPEAYIVQDGSKEEEWTRAISDCLGNGYEKIASRQLVGLFIIVYVASDHAKYINAKEVTTNHVGVGLMGVLGNKGGVAVRIRYKDSYLCVVGTHLAADTSQVERRNQDYQEVCRRLAFPSNGPYDITKSPSVNAALSNTSKMVTLFDCDHTIWAGDLNYRIGLPEDQVKSILKTTDYNALLKHDQLTAQRTLLKAFSEFEEHPIDFQPTYKYDVGTNTWDSSEKRRVPSYTDRILWRSKNPTIDSVKPYFYTSHMELLVSDHKPVSAFFRLKVSFKFSCHITTSSVEVDTITHRVVTFQVKTIIHEKQAEVYQAIVRDLDKYENECMPDATLSSSSLAFENVRYLEPQRTAITIKNTGQFPAQYRFKPKLQDETFCKPWIWVNPPVGMIMPGDSAKIHLTVMVDNESAPMLNTGKEKLDDILILHLEHGKDYFISVSGSYIRTCFGNSLEWLAKLDRPIRLWNPEDSDDEDDDDIETLYDPYSGLGAKSSMGSIRDSVNAGREAAGDILKRVKSVKSADSLASDREPLERKGSVAKAGIPNEKLVAVKKHKPARQLSLPKDLWRIVDFIYKHGFSVDNLFLLSGDQSTMSYIRECLDTGEDFDLSRLLDKPSQGADNTAVNKRDGDGQKDKGDSEKSDATSSTLLPRGSTSDLKPQIARPVSIMNGIPPKAATFGLGENRGIHSMAEVLLRFLESLREPVVPTEMYYRALEIADHRQASYGLLDLMPPVHVNVFVYVTSFLRELIMTGGSNSVSSSSNSSQGGKDSSNSNTTGSSSSGTGSTSSINRGAQMSAGSIHNGLDGNRGKKDDEDNRVSKLAAVFSSVMLRPPPTAERLSETEALKRKTFMMQFLQEPTEEEGLGGSPGGPSGGGGGGGQASLGVPSTTTLQPSPPLSESGSTFVVANPSESPQPDAKD
ncbi:hypothetical protein BGZ76_010600 [Entomortierella beljakovae]|nr:hypothetical protein BGZ76_010600 [Entomortierella beljakovae]